MYGNQWTSALVRDRLIEAFRELPNRAIYSPSETALLALDMRSPIDGGNLIVATGKYLGFRSAQRRELLRFCRQRAEGTTVAELCLAMGWPRSTLDRHVSRSCALVAEGLNRDRSPPNALHG